MGAVSDRFWDSAHFKPASLFATKEIYRKWRYDLMHNYDYPFQLHKSERRHYTSDNRGKEEATKC